MPINTEKAKSNPCLKEQELTYKCLNENNFDREKCQIYFKNYRNCKDFWGMIKSERRLKGIRPFLPPVQEREQIKSEYMKKQQ